MKRALAPVFCKPVSGQKNVLKKRCKKEKLPIDRVIPMGYYLAVHCKEAFGFVVETILEHVRWMFFGFGSLRRECEEYLTACAFKQKTI